MRRRAPAIPSHTQGIRFPLPILRRVQRYAHAVHNSDSGAVNALLEIALPIEEKRLGLPPIPDSLVEGERYPETRASVLRVAEVSPPTRKKPRRPS